MFVSHAARISNNNTLGVTRGAGTVDLPGVPEYTPGVLVVLALHKTLVFFLMFCKLMYVLFGPSDCLRLTASDFPCRIIKLFLNNNKQFNIQ